MIFGDRVLQAREMQNLSQQKLAEILGCSQTAIAKVEADVRQPSADLAKSLADTLGFPVSWFQQPVPAHFPLGSLQFRAKAAKSQRDLHKPYYVARTVFEVVESLRSRVKTLPIRVEQNVWTSPSEAATAMRSECGLSPDSPILDVVNAIEKLGIVVLGLPIHLELDGVDGFSAWTSTGVPVICLSMLTSGDRLRYTAAHELGELTLGALPVGPARHKAADDFAGEFLLPERAMRRELIPPISLTTLANLKLKWRVSMAFLLKRSAKLAIISSRHERTLWIELSRRGWRKVEPSNLAVEPERPRVVRKMIEVLYGDPINFERFALDCNLKPIFARRLVQSHLAKPSIRRSSVVAVDFAQERGRHVNIKSTEKSPIDLFQELQGDESGSNVL
jgi:Zn-dependent peptidase ImmA (M78 family)/transcriptional regulator with XRE-family HTH domain